MPDFFTASEQRGRQRNGPSVDSRIFFNCTATSDTHDDKQQEIEFCQGRCLGDDVLELLVLFVSPPKSWDYRSSNLTIKKRKI